MTLSEQINQAFADKQLFYKPWIGNKYEKGIILHGSNPVKVLVIGASRYCEYSKYNPQPCPVIDSCKYCMEYDTLLQISHNCPFINDVESRGGTHGDYKLCDINTASILKAYYGNNRINAYKNFQIVLSRLIDCEDPVDIWQHLAFFNYIQPIVVNESGSTNTPDYTGHKSIYHASRQVVETIIDILKPDTIILWLSRPLRSAIDIMFSDSREVYQIIVKRKDKSKEYPAFSVKINGKHFLLITSPHPSDYAWNYCYYEQVEQFSESFVTPSSLGKPYPSYHILVECNPWDDFISNFEDIFVEEFVL